MLQTVVNSRAGEIKGGERLQLLERRASQTAGAKCPSDGALAQDEPIQDEPIQEGSFQEGSTQVESSQEGTIKEGSTYVESSQEVSAQEELVQENPNHVGAVQAFSAQDGQAEELLLQDLIAVRQRGVRFALLGVPEDISPRANHGRGGATQAWTAFLESFANLQHNRYLDFSTICCLGSVDCSDLQECPVAITAGSPAHVAWLREQCARLDARVSRLVALICRAGLVPVVIGGGHGVAYGVMKGVVKAQSGKVCSPRAQTGLAVINCDPHADFRALEGRHSGNSFSYAQREGWLKSYQVLALHESYNSENMLQAMDKAGVSWITYEDIFLRGMYSWQAVIASVAEKARATDLPVGLEIDMDCLADMPSSAVLPYGLTLREVGELIARLAADLPLAYLHLPEAAPELGADGFRRVGRALAWLVAVFVKEYAR